MIKTDPAGIWGEYERGVSYNQSDYRNLYDTVRTNENFFVGLQWEGVAAPDLDKPVLNILKRVVNYFISVIVSDDIAASIDVFGGAQDPQIQQLLDAVPIQVDQIIEQQKLKQKNRAALRDAAVDGDACIYFYLDPELNEMGTTSGSIVAELIDNTNCLFGNPQVQDAQKQPYIILVMRKLVEEVKKEARQNGRSEYEIESIVADDDPNGINREDETGNVTELLKFWKENGTVHYTKTTQNVVIREPVDTGYQLYPVCWMSWDRVKNSYHGHSCISGLIPNQIYINKLFAMCLEHVKRMAFPKVAYNAQLLPGGWSNRVGEAIPIQGEPGQNIAQIVGGADMSSQVVQLIQQTIDYTRDTMGASDAALGNVKPDNTSAIIAVQKASETPLSLQRMDFLQFVEDYIRIILDIMRVDYGTRQIYKDNSDGTAEVLWVDFSQLGSINYKLNVDVGAASYWSELTQVQTTDNLFQMGVIPDPITYLEALPDGYVKDRQKIIDKIQEQYDLAAQNQQLQAVIAEMQGQIQQTMGGGQRAAMPGM